MEFELTGFITASSVVAGILLVWAQLWGSTAEDYAKKGQSTATAEAGLAGCYLGALSSLFALTIVVIYVLKGKQEIPSSALILFIFALVLTFLEILQSLISVTLRLRGERKAGPTPCFEKALKPRRVRISLMALILVLAAAVLVFGIYSALRI